MDRVAPDTEHATSSPVEIKRCKAFKAGVSTLRQLYGVMAADGAAAGPPGLSGLCGRLPGRPPQDMDPDPACGG
jgi:hypothetical protein